jgi:hypothetical protein
MGSGKPRISYGVEFMDERLNACRAWVTLKLTSTGLWFFVGLNMACFSLYASPPIGLGFQMIQEVVPKLFFKVCFWIASISLLGTSVWWPIATRFLRRITALNAVLMALFGILLEFDTSPPTLRPVVAQITGAALVQITSMILIAAEIGGWRRSAGKGLG